MYLDLNSYISKYLNKQNITKPTPVSINRPVSTCV